MTAHLLSTGTEKKEGRGLTFFFMGIEVMIIAFVPMKSHFACFIKN